MENCASCGHVLGVGRFCTNCGHPVGAPVPQDPPVDDWRTGTAERPMVVSPVLVAPPPARTRAPFHRGPRGWIPWAVGIVALAIVGAFGIGLLSRDDEPAATGRVVDATRSPKPSSPPPGTATPSEQPGARGDDVASLATAIVPATAPPNQDLQGNLVRYEARNMLDGVAETCWRMPGDGSGAEITFQLAEPTTLTTVGLINGYAKLAIDAAGHELDWYHGNRRVLAVEWVFDDGTTVGQTLTDTDQMQTVPVSVTTTTVQLRLLQVSAPGTGRAQRDYTAISDVTLRGTPG